MTKKTEVEIEIEIDKISKRNEKSEIDKAIDQMGANWPSPVLARKAVSEFTGGVLSGKTLARR